MTIWLQNNEKYDRVASLDPASGVFGEHSRSALDQESPVKTDGIYSILSGAMAAVFAWDDAVFVCLGTSTAKLSGETKVSVDGPPSSRKLSIEDGNGIVAQHQYSLEPSQLPIPGDTTPFVEDEDFDFGLLMSNIASSDQRQAVLLGID
ncbi:MAG: hypothetical protein AAGJ46_09740 [Planctomycetota bacterium]